MTTLRPIFTTDCQTYISSWSQECTSLSTMQMVQTRTSHNGTGYRDGSTLYIVRISFMMAGRTKFQVDQLLPQIVQSNKSDALSTAELGEVSGLHASVSIDHGDIVMDWQECLK